jgi:hypothetical protein
MITPLCEVLHLFFPPPNSPPPRFPLFLLPLCFIMNPPVQNG